MFAVSKCSTPDMPGQFIDDVMCFVRSEVLAVHVLVNKEVAECGDALPLLQEADCEGSGQTVRNSTWEGSWKLECCWICFRHLVRPFI